MRFFDSEKNFLGITEKELFQYDSSKVVIQSVPYEFTSSYLAGSKFGPEAILEASHYVEFYDEETDSEAYKSIGICTLEPLNFDGKVNAEAIELIYSETLKHLNNNKFVVSVGAEHTVTYGFVKAFKEKFNNLSVLQIDAHSDLRNAYQDNPYSHASVMARVHDLKIPICQIAIRAQCKEEADLIKSSPLINTWYNHQLDKDDKWMDDCIDKLGENVYLTIDADGFDPSVMPAVGTAEPGGLQWNQSLKFFRKVAEKRNIVGFDIVETAPKDGEILTQFNLAKLLYKIITYLNHYNKFN